ncbi:MAG: hypothetical protein IKC84_02745 [Helicobacteraceae bacterium]|nr:hypothetical protein [Helicobacteraceae bacterium]
MNLVLAILSFFGAVLLPGAILQKIFIKEKFVISSFVIYSFIFSLCFNFVLISFLILTRIYTQNIVVSILFIEWIVFLYIFRNEIIYGIHTPKITQIQDNNAKIYFILGTLISLYMLNNILKVDIFYAWDAVVSWNRWATELASMDFVLNDGGYPQLYPMLISLGYVASGKISSFQGIGVAIWQYFAFAGIVCSIFLLPKDSKDMAKWSAFGLILGVITYLAFFSLTNQFFVGYVDMPVSMIILMSSLLMLKASICLDENDKQNAYKYLILSAFCAGISCQIKQAGLFYIAVYAICLFYLYFKYKISNKILLLCIFIAALFVMPWAIIAMYKKFILDMDATNASYTMSGIYGDKSPLERLMNNIWNPFSLFALAGLFSIISKNVIIGIFGIFGFLYFIFWGCFLSYDLRNMQAGIPFMIIATSYLLYSLFSKKDGIFLFLYKRVGLLFISFIIVGLIISFFSQEKILQGEYKRKTTLGGKEISKIISDTYKNRGEKMLLTGNQPIAYNPNINRGYKHYNFNIQDDKLIQDLNDFKNDNGAFYILLTKNEYNIHKDILKDSIYLGDDGYYILLEFN